MCVCVCVFFVFFFVNFQQIWHVLLCILTTLSVFQYLINFLFLSFSDAKKEEEGSYSCPDSTKVTIQFSKDSLFRFFPSEYPMTK